VKPSKQHIESIISKRIEQSLNLDLVKALLSGVEISAAQYLSMKTVIEHLIRSLVFEFSGSNESGTSTELGLDELKRMLNYKDNRSVINWCQNNSVYVISQGNNHVVNRSEFKLAFYKPLIDRLKKTKENWKELVTNYLSGQIDALLTDSGTDKPVISKYSPKSQIEKSFLNKMKKI